MSRRLWTREEFMLVMNLYTKIRYGQFNNRNSEVIKLANLINKTPGAVAYKLVHLSSQDPYHQNRGIKGLANPGKNAIEIYRDFQANWDEMLYESEVLLAKYKNKTIEQEYSEWEDVDLEILKTKKGLDKERLVKTRVNQSLFRRIITNNYSNSCAICNLNIDKLLVASHILKWSENEKERLNPENGLCLCNIHDKAFELGYIGIKGDYQLNISEELAIISEETYVAMFKRHQNQKIIMPDKFYPNPSFLDNHYQSTFRK
ncbi:MAG: HNH endonuclease [Brumimicrobium sp.]